MSDPRLRISNLTHVEGYWQATVTCAGDRVEVDRKYGSWMGLLADDELGLVARCEVPRWVAEALQSKVLRIERAANRERAAA